MTALVILLVVIIVALGVIFADVMKTRGTDSKYDQAIIRLDGDVYYDVDVQSWRRINSNEVEITGMNGTVYRTHLNNVILLGGGEK